MTKRGGLQPQASYPPFRDADCYRTAESIQRDHPNWLVMWGVYTRQFAAFPLFPAPAGTIVQSANTGELTKRMQQTELGFRTGPSSARRNNASFVMSRDWRGECGQQPQPGPFPPHRPDAVAGPFAAST